MAAIHRRSIRAPISPSVTLARGAMRMPPPVAGAFATASSRISPSHAKPGPRARTRCDESLASLRTPVSAYASAPSCSFASAGVSAVASAPTPPVETFRNRRPLSSPLSMRTGLRRSITSIA